MATETLYRAVKYALDRSQTDPDFGYYCGPGTQVFYLLVQAEAEHLGRPLADVEAERARDLQPSYRRREPEAVRLREELYALKQLCEQNGLDWSAAIEAERSRA